MRVHSPGERWFDVANYTLLATLAFVCFYPFVMMTVLSINAGTDSMRGGITLWPRVFTLVNYRVILENAAIQRAYVVTVMRTVIGTASGVFVTALVAYGLAERRLPGRKYIMVFMVIPMFFSGGLIPYFLQLRDLRLINTFWVYVIPLLFNIWNAIVMKTFFQEIPVSLKESARLDGANELVVLFRIVFPVSKPLFAAISLFVAVGHWNDWFAGAFFVTRQHLRPVQTYLMGIMTADLSDSFNQETVQAAAQQLMGRFITDYSTITSLSLRMAAVMIAVLPILMVYPFLQKYFVKGVLIGSLKG